jgi:hypothetical protein
MARLGEVLSFFSCAHRYSWPFKADAGQYYQVCVDCGAEYNYDWDRMQRVARSARAPRPARAERRTHPSWRPRERRLKLPLPLRFRIDDALWRDGTVVNISRSGVLFWCPPTAGLKVGEAVQLVFEMPEEISGADSARVLCRGRIARIDEADDALRVAIAMYGYTFLEAAASAARQ